MLRRRPHDVVLDVTERCNLKCVMCYFAGTDRLRFAPFDASLSKNGMMPVEVFERVAAELFPRAWRVAMACAAEPMIHPKFADLITIAGRYKVPDIWFPTNLLALTETKAEAIVDAGVRTVAVSMDGTDQETYERIRIGGKFDRLLQRLELLRTVRARHPKNRTRMRLIYTWMKSNREDLRNLPAFAEREGVHDLDVRFVAETAGVDNRPELLTGEDPESLRSELRAVAEDAVRRGIKLHTFPEFEPTGKRSVLAKIQRRLWRRRAGLDRIEHRLYAWRERLNGCGYPGANWVVRPNGAVSPCIFWDREPLGMFPEASLAGLDTSGGLNAIREGLQCGQPIGTCATCDQRRDALYRPFRKLVKIGEGRAVASDSRSS
ncbi:MAG: radical SAM protein [Acidobacteriota bacterium]